MWSRNFGSATQGVRKPGVWEPCPGHTTTITYLVSQSFDGLGCVTPTKNAGEHCLGYTTRLHGTGSAASGTRVDVGNGTDDERGLQDERLAGAGGIPADHLGDSLEAVANRVGVHEELARGCFEGAPIVEVAPQ